MDFFEYAEICSPAAMDEGIHAYRDIIERHHRAVMGGDYSMASRIRTEAHKLAVRLNGGTNFGMSGHPWSSACVLERETSAPYGMVPLWGQLGTFTVDVDGVPIRIVLDGILGITFPMFEAHSIDGGPAAFSETGYRHFLGFDGRTDSVTPDAFAVTEIQIQIEREKNKPGKKKRRVKQ